MLYFYTYLNSSIKWAAIRLYLDTMPLPGSTSHSPISVYVIYAEIL
jgi:hypothetical protein